MLTVCACVCWRGDLSLAAVMIGSTGAQQRDVEAAAEGESHPKKEKEKEIERCEGEGNEIKGKGRESERYSHDTT